MEDDSCGRHCLKSLRTALLACCWIAAALLLVGLADGEDAGGSAVPVAPEGSASEAIAVDPQGAADRQDAEDTEDTEADPLSMLLAVLPPTLLFLAASAFFSASEVAFFSLHRLRLRSMGESNHALERLAARLMAHPGNLLTTILMGNCIVNVLLGVVFAARVEIILATRWNPALAYAAAVLLATAVLVFFGEVLPKLVVVRRADAFAKVAAAPLFMVDGILMPLRTALMFLVGQLFRVTGFSRVRPAPFMTDDEFVSLLEESEATGAIESDERQMIQGILEFSDVMLREILVPRPDMVTLEQASTVAEALAVFREHEYARMPVCEEDVDHVVGVLYAKDLIHLVDEGRLEETIKPLVRKAHFVPETMSVADFLKSAQRLRAHLAIVVDEFGGTEGLVTLQDALREVVGDIGEEDDDEAPSCVAVEEGVYIVEGGLPLDELETLIGVDMENGEHTTVAGFLMEQTDKILEAGDRLEHEGVEYTVEDVEGKRVARVRISVQDRDEEDSK